jgi:hypothetical protein
VKDGKYCQLTFDGNGGVPLEWYQSNFAKDILLEELVKMAEKEVSSDGLAAKPTPMGILQGRLCSRLPIRSSDGSVSFALISGLNATPLPAEVPKAGYGWISVQLL